jgi:hypothetical protein
LKKKNTHSGPGSRPRFFRRPVPRLLKEMSLIVGPTRRDFGHGVYWSVTITTTRAETPAELSAVPPSSHQEPQGGERGTSRMNYRPRRTEEKRARCPCCRAWPIAGTRALAPGNKGSGVAPCAVLLTKPLPRYPRGLGTGTGSGQVPIRLSEFGQLATIDSLRPRGVGESSLISQPSPVRTLSAAVWVR